MARKVFSTDSILDAARTIVVTRGARAATVEAIASQAGVPVGSIYHRFDSIEQLLAATRLRAVRRTQARALSVAVSRERPLESAQELALAMYDQCLAEPQDTRLLDALGHAEVLRMAGAGRHEEARTVNDGVLALMAELARAMFGRADARTLDLVLLALVDLPHGFARREIESGRHTPARRRRLPGAVAAVLS